MRLDNVDLAAAIALLPGAIPRAFAQVLIDRPTSKGLNALALTYLGLPPMPAEDWREPLPSLPDAETALIEAIGALNTTYNNGTRLADEIAVRRVAWAATCVTRLLEHRRRKESGATVTGLRNNPATFNNEPIDSAARRAKVIDAVHTSINERNRHE